MLPPGLNPSPGEPQYSPLIGRVMDNTAMKDYKRCPKLFDYTMRQSRRGRGMLSPALAYGSGWHHVMEYFYKSPAVGYSELVDGMTDYVAERWKPSSDPSDYRTFNRCMVEAEKYLKKWGMPWEDDLQTVGWPDTPLVEITIELPIPGARHPYAGKLDRIGTKSGQLLAEDHKTASQFRSDYFRQWETDDQMVGYDTLAGIITGQAIGGVRINLHVIRKSDSEFERRTIPFSPKRKEHWRRNYDYWLSKIEAETLAEQAGEPAWEQNYSACAGKYGMCSYHEVCTADPDRRQYILEQDFDVQNWNPLEADAED